MHTLRLLLPLVIGCSAAPPSSGKSATDTGGSDPATPCSATVDTDADGLDDCTEAELGTDPSVQDTDGDGFSDAEEVACVSDPLASDEACYACGWPHNDPGTLSDPGAEVGDTMANLALVDQCGERVDLWDFAGSWHVLYATASWCSSCLRDAEQFDAVQAGLAEETGLPVAIPTVLFQDSGGSLPGPDEGRRYAELAGIVQQPVFADPVAGVLAATSYDGRLLPGVCVLSPDLELVACAEGPDAFEAMIDVVRAEARR